MSSNFTNDFVIYIFPYPEKNQLLYICIRLPYVEILTFTLCSYISYFPLTNYIVMTISVHKYQPEIVMTSSRRNAKGDLQIGGYGHFYGSCLFLPVPSS